MKRRLTHKTNIAVLTTAGVLATVGIGYAAIPASNGTIKSCYATTNGLLLGIPHSKGDTRIVDSAEACRSYEKTLSWNQVGPKGDKGDQGIQGVQGIPGKDGLNGAPGKDGLNGAPGADGNDGAPGTNGQDGAPGPAGPSDAYIAHGDPQRDQNTVHLNVPAGSYAITGKGSVFNADGDSQSWTCRLSTGNTAGGRAFPSLDHGNRGFTVLDLATFAVPTTITLSCGGFKILAHQLGVTAIKVGAIHG